MTISDVNETQLEPLANKVMADVGGAFGLFMAYMGDQAGVYQALDENGPCTSIELANKAGVDARYLLEWLSANAAAGYVTYHADDETFSLSPEQALIFTREGQPNCMQGFFQLVVGQYAAHDNALETFRAGSGRAWGEHHSCCFCGTDRFFRPGYMANLVDNWIPSLVGIESKLRHGSKVADIGCGRGSSTLLMAQAYPNSSFYGFDFHPPSIAEANGQAVEAGVDNIQFEVAAAKDYPGQDFDLICIFDALHDMGDPVGAARHIKNSLKPDGTLMLVEPLAGDSLSDNLNLLGQIFYSASTTICTPASKAQEVGLALGAQAGQKRLTEILNQAGFSKVRRANETPTNMVLEVRI